MTEPKPKLSMGWAELMQVLGRAAQMGRLLTWANIRDRVDLQNHGKAAHWRRKGPGRHHQNGPTHIRLKRATGPGSYNP